MVQRYATEECLSLRVLTRNKIVWVPVCTNKSEYHNKYRETKHRETKHWIIITF